MAESTLIPWLFRLPTISGDDVILSARTTSGTFSANGGRAFRLTARGGRSELASLLADGSQVAFVGREEGRPRYTSFPRLVERPSV